MTEYYSAYWRHFQRVVKSDMPFTPVFCVDIPRREGRPRSGSGHVAGHPADEARRRIAPSW